MSRQLSSIASRPQPTSASIAANACQRSEAKATADLTQTPRERLGRMIAGMELVGLSPKSQFTGSIQMSYWVRPTTHRDQTDSGRFGQRGVLED
jgi:hypothetical protein